MKYYSLVLVAVSASLMTSCGPAFDTKETLAKKTAMVVFSGPYRQQSTEQPNLLQRAVGQENPYQQLKVVRTGAVFEKDDNSGESFAVLSDMIGQGSRYGRADVSKLSKYYNFDAMRVIPGRYYLTDYYFGKHKQSYNEQACGKITIEVNAGEAVYIGGFRPAAESHDSIRKPFLPKFQVEQTPTVDSIKHTYFFEEYPDWVKSLKWLTRLPVNETKNPPDDCATKDSAVWNMFN